MSSRSCDPWPFEWSCDITDVDQAILDLASGAAQEYLWALTGRRFGVCTVVGELYRAASGSACGMPYKDGSGRWRNGGRADCCSLLLEQQPVTSIGSVTVEGEAVLLADVALEGNRLISIDGCWPTIPDCDPAAIEVSYTYGHPVPQLGQLALAEVACEMLAGLTGGSCRLPGRAVSVSRQGVTIDMQDSTAAAESGLTGLPIADAWITSVNPARLTTRSRVHSPDIPRSVS